MAASDDAYAAALRLIEQARVEGAIRLDLDLPKTRALTVLPPEIAGLDKLKALDLSNSQVSDLSPLAGMVGITELWLYNSQVSDLSPLAGMVGMTTLSLSNTQVSDLSPLAWMAGMTQLWLHNTQVSDLSPLAGMEAVTELRFSNTQVSDLSPLAGMEAMTELRFSNTQVSDLSPLAGMAALNFLEVSDCPVADLRPIRALTKLLAKPENANALADYGLRFKSTTATRIDPRIAEIAEIGDYFERTRVLFDYLEGWEVPAGDWSDVLQPEETSDPAVVPQRRPAPLEIEITDTLITIAGHGGLPQRDANTRAALGWEAIRDFRQDFASSFSVSNYAPLPALLAAFDRAMGDAYDPARVVRIGVQAQRFVALTQDAEFMSSLPTGGAGDLRMFTSETLVYLNRFPDWVAYREDAEAMNAPGNRETVADYEEIRDVLNGTPEATEEVRVEYAAEVAEANSPSATEIEAKALASSTRELQRELAERVSKRQRYNRESARKGGDLIDDIFRKPLGVPHHLALKLEKPMRSLQQKGVPGFGWVSAWYDAHFGPEGDRGK